MPPVNTPRAAPWPLTLPLPASANCTVWVRLDSQGPALHRQERVGLGRRRFTMLKFRSMSATAESERLAADEPESDPAADAVRAKLDTIGKKRDLFDVEV